GEDEAQLIVLHGTGLLLPLLPLLRIDGFIARVQQRRLRVPVAARRLPAEVIDGPVSRRRDDPPGWARGQASGRPPLERRDERVLHCLLSDVDVAEHPREDGDSATV